ncbi:putative metallocarboxypeptidase ecm14, partial [Oleoguttula sp. CCFEE 5521]
MRFGRLILPIVLLFDVCAGVPSPSPPPRTLSCRDETAAQQSVQKPTSRWRRLSSHVIAALWKQETCAADRSKAPASKIAAPVAATAPAHTAARYGSDVVLRFNVSSVDELDRLKDATDTLLLDVWDYTSSWVDLRLAKDLVPSLLSLLPSSLKQSHMPLFQDISLAQAVYDTYPEPKDGRTARVAQHSVAQPAHFDQRAKLPSHRTSTSSDTNIFFTDYQPLTVIDPWLRLLSSLFTTHTRLITIGHSAENRPISALRIGVHPTNSEDQDPPKRKTILITGGLHAREWISTSTANFVAYSLVTSYGKSESITQMLQDFDFVVVPTLNPDGYAYTWTTDRLWRKTRQSTSLRFCPGMDLDHSFNFSFPSTAGGTPCSEAFPGDAAFQATEAKALASWAKNETESKNVEFIALLDLHSYSQQILYPYAYSCSTSPPGLEDLEELAFGLEKAIRRSGGHAYEVLPACEGNTIAAADSKRDKTLLPQLENAGGSMLDYFYHELRVRYAYQFKLRDRGTYGFLLPKEQILPVGREVLEAVLYLGGFLQESLGMKVKVTEDGESSDEPEASDGAVPLKEGERPSNEEGWVIVQAAREDAATNEEDLRWDL